MGLSWISPLYLVGALLLALPVLIHLVQRQQLQGIKFPSLMFLEQVPQREKRRLEIRHWLLLLLRCLLLLLVVLAFARPFLTADGASLALDPGRKDSVIVLDRSYSMRLGSRWQQAQATALQLVDEKGSGDRIGLVLFDESSEVLSDLSTDADDLRSAIRRQLPGLQTTRLRIGVEQAARLLSASNASRRQILLISDFQAGAAAAEPPKITRDIELKTFAVETGRPANAAISALLVGPSSRGTAEEFSLRVEVTNHAASELVQQVRLTVNGRALAQRELRLPAGQRATATFDDLGSSGLLRGVVSLDDDALALDNRAFFVHSSRQRVPILIVESPQARLNQSLYLENALRLARNPEYSVTRRSWQDLRAEDLPSWAVIIVNDESIPGGVMGRALRDFVAAGGGLLVASGDRVQANWPGGNDGFLPGKPLRQVDSRPGAAHTIGRISAAHALAANGGLELSPARVYSYRKLEPRATDQVLARYSDGGVALLEATRYPGRVLVLTTTLDTHWNDLALQPVFLPFLHRALHYLAAFESQPQVHRVGSVVDAMSYARAQAGSEALVAAADAGDLVVESPSATEIRLDRRGALLSLDEPGFYQVHRATPANVAVVLAANIDPVESIPEILDVAGFVEEIRGLAEASPGAALLTRRQAAEYEQQQQLWHAILVLALVLMLVEAFAANWIVRRRSTTDAAKS